jgi:hypothetical protein
MGSCDPVWQRQRSLFGFLRARHRRTPAQFHPRSRPQISPHGIPRREVRPKAESTESRHAGARQVVVGTGESRLGRGMRSAEAMVVRMVPARVRRHAILRHDASSSGTMRGRKARKPAPEPSRKTRSPSTSGQTARSCSTCCGPRAASSASRRTPPSVTRRRSLHAARRTPHAGYVGEVTSEKSPTTDSA